jgi:hypothetical protein
MDTPGSAANASSRTSSDDSIPPNDIPPPPDEAQWDDAAEQFLLSLLTNVQASASTWSGAIAALLGLFGSVALVTGPSDITKLGQTAQIIVVSLTLLAGVLAGVALILTTIAQQLPSVHSENWRGSVYRDYVVRTSETARIQLNVARILGILAAVAVFAVGVIVLFVGLMASGS